MSECIWCPDWKPQSDIVDGFIRTAAMRAGQPNLYAKAGGIPFRFCPWCGHELHEVAERPAEGKGVSK